MAVLTRGTVVGVFSNHDDARAAVNDLRSEGFPVDQIGVAGRDWRDEHLVGTDLTEDYAAEGAATGAAAGAGIGALWGLGIMAGVLPVLGPAIAGGTLAAVLSSAAAGAATAGVTGALVGMGVSKEDAAYYESEFHSGRIVLTVSAPGQEALAADIIQRHGGVNRSHA